MVCPSDFSYITELRHSAMGFSFSVLFVCMYVCVSDCMKLRHSIFSSSKTVWRLNKNRWNFESGLSMTNFADRDCCLAASASSWNTYVLGINFVAFETKDFFFILDDIFNSSKVIYKFLKYRECRVFFPREKRGE